MQEHLRDDEPVRVYGWANIAATISLGRVSAVKLAKRERDPLPVEHGHLGVWSYATALRDWVRRQNKPYRVHIEMLQLRRRTRGAKR